MQELIAVAYTNRATTITDGDGATMSPNALYIDPTQAVKPDINQNRI